MSNLIKAAEGGYPPAFQPYGSLLEYTDSPEAARPWYEKSAEAGNFIGMACLGRVLINTGDKTNGVKWLKKALTCPNLDGKNRAGGIWQMAQNRAPMLRHC